MSTIKLHKDFLENELNLPYSAIRNTISDTSRWRIHHNIIFAHNGKFYETYYSVGATEMQDEGPWEYDEEVECFEVKLVEKTIKVWERI